MEFPFKYKKTHQCTQHNTKDLTSHSLWKVVKLSVAMRPRNANVMAVTPFSILNGMKGWGLFYPYIRKTHQKRNQNLSSFVGQLPRDLQELSLTGKWWNWYHWKGLCVYFPGTPTIWSYLSYWVSYGRFRKVGRICPRIWFWQNSQLRRDFVNSSWWTRMCVIYGWKAKWV